MKVRASIKKICKDCKIVKRGLTLRVVCKANPKHKQTAGLKEILMARILGVDIPRNKAMKIALRTLYGVGPKVAVEVLEKSNIDPNKSSNDLTEEEVQVVRKILDEQYSVEGDLRRQVGLNIKAS